MTNETQTHTTEQVPQNQGNQNEQNKPANSNTEELKNYHLNELIDKIAKHQATITELMVEVLPLMQQTEEIQNRIKFENEEIARIFEIIGKKEYKKINE